MKSVLVVAAHPDDEVLGCGGTMALLAEQGWHIHVLILAEGITSRGAERNRVGKSKDLTALGQAAHEANKELGVTSLTLKDFPDNRMDSVDLLDVVKTVEEFIEKYKPEIVFTHHAHDVNIDHQVTHDAVLTACRPTPQSCVRKLLFFEVLSSTEWRPAASRPSFTPSVYYDVSAQIKKKMAALECYADEMRPFPHPRSLKAIEALATWRGASCGCMAAEAFESGFVLHKTEGKL